MFDFKVLDVDHPDWGTIVKSSSEYDFYHTAAYHKLEKGEGTPLLFVCIRDDEFLALPLIIRSIPETPYYDATSVYGYCGPLTSKESNNISADLKEDFKNKIKAYFSEAKVVSVFSRLHPIIEISNFFDDFGSIINVNKTVAIDLSLAIDEQRRKYRKSNKSELNQLRKKGFTVTIAKNDDEVQEFITIYKDTMKRVGATSNYYFSDTYFKELLSNNDFKSNLLLAFKDEEIIAGAIFTITKSIMQYHLAGTKESFMRETPMKLVLDEARLLANKLNLDYLHLGGGVGGSDEDSLFRFKKGFSDCHFQFSVWKYIHNKAIYNSLVKDKGADISSSFFPIYRSV